LQYFFSGVKFFLSVFYRPSGFLPDDFSYLLHTSKGGSMQTDQKLSFSPGLQKATGKIPVTLTNDIVLHAVTQQNEKVLRGLMASLLKIPEEEIVSIKLLNPIDYRTYDAKEIVLDIKVELNEKKLINVELQVHIATDSPWWINRSLLYLCRIFDNLKAGENYGKILPSMQISIVTKDIFSDAEPEFYAHYLLKNTKSGHVYTGNFGLNVLYLNHLDLATESDKKSGLHYWARAFLAETWEDLKSLAAGNSMIREVAESMCNVNADDSKRTLAEAHQKYLEIHNHILEEHDEAFRRLDEAIQSRDEAIRNNEIMAEKYKAAEESLQADLQAAQKRIAELEAELAKK